MSINPLANHVNMRQSISQWRWGIVVLSDSHVIPWLAAFLISPHSPPKFLIENTRYFQIEAEFSRKGTSSIMFIMNYVMVFLVRSPMLKLKYFIYFFLKKIHFCEKDRFPIFILSKKFIWN